MSLLLCSMLSAAVLLAPQQAPAGSATASERPSVTAGDPPQLPVSIERVRRALERPSVFTTETSRPVFRMEVFGRKPSIEDILGPGYLQGPVPYGGMTHQEFLSLVTPKDVQGFSAFSNKEGMVVAATSLVLGWALQSAIHRLQTARGSREIEAARREVQDALAELAKARERAGLPPK